MASNTSVWGSGRAQYEIQVERGLFSFSGCNRDQYTGGGSGFKFEFGAESSHGLEGHNYLIGVSIQLTLPIQVSTFMAANVL